MLRRFPWGPRILSALTVCLVGQSCASVTQTPVSIQEEQDRFIRVEGRYGDVRREANHRFDHPITIIPEDWRRILSSIRVQSHNEGFLFISAKGPSEAAFSSEEISYLSPGFSKAFAEAHPDEFVVFGLARPRSPDITEITTGGWFVEGQRLHLILANYRQGVTMPQVRKRLWQDPLLSNTSPSYDLLPGDYQSVGQGKGVAALLGSNPPELLIDYRALIEGKPILQAPATAGSSPKEAEPSGSLEDRLRTLKNLREQGLITEEEYRAKKKQLLDRL